MLMLSAEEFVSLVVQGGVLPPGRPHRKHGYRLVVYAILVCLAVNCALLLAYVAFGISACHPLVA